MFFLIAVLIAASSPPSSGVNWIDALAKMTPGIEYVTDGSADASVMAIGQNDHGVIENPPKELAGIVALGAKAIPLLIAHLDDRTATAHRFVEAPGVPVPIGFVCLDILVAITEGPMSVPDCTDDGFGACVMAGYFFRPDSSRDEILAVKRNWQRALQEGSIKFVFPSWWSGG